MFKAASNGKGFSETAVPPWLAELVKRIVLFLNLMGRRVPYAQFHSNVFFLLSRGTLVFPSSPFSLFHLCALCNQNILAFMLLRCTTFSYRTLFLLE